MTQKHSSRVATAGFTLLEMLVALAVLGIVLAGLTGGLHFGIDAYRRQATDIGDQDDMGAADRAIRALLTQMETGDRLHQQFIKGDPQSLSFVTRLPAAGNAERIEATIAATPDHRLVLVWRFKDHTMSFDPLPASKNEILLRDIASIRFAYFSAETGWLPDWKSASPPRLVRLHILFTPQHRGIWPDIVVTPVHG